MGFFDFLKKKKDTNEILPSTWLPTPPPVYNYDRTSPIEGRFAVELNKSDLKRLRKDRPNKTDFAHLDKDGELPFGWTYHSKEFTDKIKKEFSYFLNCWINVRGKNTSEEYAALKSLITYIKDAEKLCKLKGECFSKWFSDCIADRQYLKKRELELEQLQHLLS